MAGVTAFSKDLSELFGNPPRVKLLRPPGHRRDREVTYVARSVTLGLFGRQDE
ncbi:hypothetical protein SAMN04489731_101841 [Amycolatopsis regifaucium]|nr:hypothetical protein SAMN04489731_101841 [Amycolatopsis regifaucium]